MQNQNITFITMLLALGFLALSPIAQAVVPPPDGGYPNFTTAEGTKALFSLTSGAANTAVGWFSLFSNTDGSFNTASNVICIGANVAGNDVNDSCYIGNIFGDTSSGGTAVFINSNGRLGTVQSSRRFKEEIKPMDKASEALLALKPVSFRYKKEVDAERTPQFGLVAEQVEKVNPDLVTRDPDGKAFTVRYEAVNAMLLNEFLKEHRQVEEQSRKIQEQDATITQFKKEMQTIAARLKEQDSKIQKVSARLELQTAPAQTAANSK